MFVRLSLLERLLLRLHLLPTPIMDGFAGILFGRALTIAVRRGFFDTLAGGEMSEEELAVKTGLDRRAIGLLAEAFVPSGYLRKHGGKYTLTEESAKWLVSASPSYIGNLIHYFETLYSRWSYLDYSLEHGKPPKPYFEIFDSEDWKIYVYGMRDLARLLYPHISSRLSLHSSAQHLLDLGGSHGFYSIQVCRRYPQLSATIMDFPEALTHTSSLIKKEGMDARMVLKGGDFTKTEFPAPQDCVLIFNVIHGFTEAENRTLIGRAMDVLQPGGKLYLLDQVRDEKGRSPLARLIPLMVGLNLLNEIGGETYGVTQIRDWCRGASRVSVFRLRMPGVTLIEAIK